jgi:hypothetical protein
VVGGATARSRRNRYADARVSLRVCAAYHPTRALALVAALSLVACSGSSRIEGTSRSSSGGTAGTSGGTAGTSGTTAGTSGMGTGQNDPMVLPAPDAIDLSEPKPSGEPLLLARAQLGPIALALDDDNVYWLNRGTFESSLKDEYSNGDASVMKCARKGCGGQPTALASNRRFSDRGTLAFALGGHYLYWNDSPQAFGDTSLVRCDVAGCDLSPEPVLSRSAHALAADSARLYATQYQAEVFTCSAEDCEGSVADLWAAGYTPIATDVAADATGVYWTTVGPDGVRTCPATGCDNSPGVVMPSNSGLVSTTEIALDAENVYVADTNACSTGALVACKKTGCPAGPARLADGLETPTSIVTDGAHVYFGEQANPLCGHALASVRRCGVNGCENSPETLALGLTVPSAVAVDREFVFVADSGSGAVWRLPKAPESD